MLGSQSYSHTLFILLEKSLVEIYCINFSYTYAFYTSWLVNIMIIIIRLVRWNKEWGPVNVNVLSIGSYFIDAMLHQACKSVTIVLHPQFRNADQMWFCINYMTHV